MPSQVVCVMKKEGEAGLVQCSKRMFIHCSNHAMHSCVCVFVCVCARVRVCAKQHALMDEYISQLVCVCVVVVRTFDVRDVFGPEMFPLRFPWLCWRRNTWFATCTELSFGLMHGWPFSCSMLVEGSHIKNVLDQVSV